MKAFYSNGKLLLTGEYLVLNGAQALAVPTKFGQSLEILEAEQNQIHWTSFDADHSIWFEAQFTKDDIYACKDDFENSITNTLINILHFADIQNPAILAKSVGYKIFTKLTFSKNWGLGTSSTLLNNISQWFEIDAFDLLKKSFGGSGYDIACAQHNTPIIYELQQDRPIIHPVLFNPHFKKHIYFVYLNKKQSSKAAIVNYVSTSSNVIESIKIINNLTLIISTTSSLDAFCEALHLHEIKLSAILQTPTIQNKLFSDFDGTIKSLGAWGGDFVMVVSQSNPTEYFSKKGFKTIVTYEDMVL